MSSDEADNNRRRFLTAATVVVGAVGTRCRGAVPFLASWNPSARAKNRRCAGGGRHQQARTGPANYRQMARQAGMGGAPRPRPWRPCQGDRRAARSRSRTTACSPNMPRTSIVRAKPEYLIMEGICTHLGCSPTYRPEITADFQGGFFCPCHGSKFDFAGRVYQGVPAPTEPDRYRRITLSATA